MSDEGLHSECLSLKVGGWEATNPVHPHPTEMTRRPKNQTPISHAAPPHPHLLPSTAVALPTLPFSKYHGIGNDFILIDNRQSETPLLTPEQARAVRVYVCLYVAALLAV